MVTEARKKKEQAVCMSVELYLRQGMGKMDAIKSEMDAEMKRQLGLAKEPEKEAGPEKIINPCPNCGETLEFDLSCLEDEECDCGCCHDHE